MKNKEWAIMIAVVLVVAIAASLITTNITGNTIKAARGYGPNAKEVYTTTEVYTKYETNALVAEVISRTATNKSDVLNMLNKSDVLNMLNKCIIANARFPAPSGVSQTGDYICSTVGDGKYKCVSNFIGFNSGSNTISQPIFCSNATNNYPAASWARTTCCSP